MRKGPQAVATAVLLIAILGGWAVMFWLNARSSVTDETAGPGTNSMASNLPVVAGSKAASPAPPGPVTNMPQNAGKKPPPKRPLFYGK